MEQPEFRKPLWDMGRMMISDITSMLAPFAQEYGLTMLQMRLILEIQSTEPATVGSLVHVMGENSGNCSSACKKLETAGFLIRRRCPDDERCVEVILTDKSREMLGKMSRDAESCYQALLQDIPQEELEEILAGIRRLGESLHRLCETSMP